MSGLNKLDKKVRQGKNWRGEITVFIDGDEITLTVRQLTDLELKEVMGMINKEELKQLKDDIDSEKLEEYNRLQDIDERTEEEEAQLKELSEELEDSDIDFFSALSDESFKGIQLAAKYAVEPSRKDLAEAFDDTEFCQQVQEEYSIQVRTPDDLYVPLKDRFKQNIDDSTNMMSFIIGMQALVTTAGDEKK